MKLVILMQLHLSWAIFRRDLSRGASTTFCLCLFLGSLWLSAFLKMYGGGNVTLQRQVAVSSRARDERETEE